jgi:hypothetical protein
VCGFVVLNEKSKHDLLSLNLMQIYRTSSSAVTTMERVDINERGKLGIPADKVLLFFGFDSKLQRT